jgi:ssDNA-binding replication factor A large subunit
MDDANYGKLVGIISKSSGVDRNEIENRVNAKRERISGLISREGAAQIVAAELGVKFDDEKLKINELIPGMKKVNTTGKIINLFPVRIFTRNGQESKVANMVLADDTSNLRVVLWDSNHINLIEDGKISQGSSVEILNATMRDNELHLGSFSEFKPSTEVFEVVNTQKILKEKNISDFSVSDNVNVRAFIVQNFEPRFFNVCNECKKKVIQDGEIFSCEQHGKVVPEKRALMNIVLDDGTETIRAVLFHEKLNSLGFSSLEPETLSLEKQNILGKEMIFSGTVRLNKFFNNPELIIDDAQEINIDEFLKNLEN